MARFRSTVGFVSTRETTPGVWEDLVTERPYRGDVLKHDMKWQPASAVNDDINLSNRISIVADSYAYEHIGIMRYVVWRGVRFKISNIEESSPRLILTIGGIYNGPQA